MLRCGLTSRSSWKLPVPQHSGTDAMSSSLRTIFTDSGKQARRKESHCDRLSSRTYHEAPAAAEYAHTLLVGFMA